jgi:hypothetical protein
MTTGTWNSFGAGVGAKWATTLTLACGQGLIGQQDQ